ncbi:hypothetical protein F5050DRAFT_630492 [Lentinula boryana]|uniref:Heat shock protein 9/12 n=1 Tax=Lentinula boryana TaxID=40481 RepID=A0ABQ8QNY3_9AGAR|nr:hypothetical protein F5050DRAFT_630492 [Lentinula boryana]
MSDNARESFTSKTKAAVVPDSEKSTSTHLKDKVKGNADDAASAVQPEKSDTQKAGDAISGNNSESLLDKTKDTLGLNKN